MSRLVALALCLVCTGAAEAPLQDDSTDEHVLELLDQASSYLEEDAAKRKAAKDALVEIGGPVVPTLISRLDTPDVMMRLALDDVLPRIGEPAVDALHNAFRNPRSVLERRRAASLISTIASARSEAVLAEASGDTDWAVRAAAAAGLGKLAAQDPVAREHLLALVGDDDWGVRLRAVLALGDAGVADDIDLVAARLRDRHFAVRLAAAEILGDQGRRAVGPIAVQLEEAEATRVERLTCIQALGRTKHPAAAVYIEPLLIAPHHLVRFYAAEAYGATAAAAGAPLCEALLETETDPSVRRALTEALVAIEARATSAGPPPPDAERSSP
jgi:HEAT repeat protein